jgi:hypothetical protein
MFACVNTKQDLMTNPVIIQEVLNTVAEIKRKVVQLNPSAAAGTTTILRSRESNTFGSEKDSGSESSDAADADGKKLMMMGDDDKVKNCGTTITIDSNTDAKENQVSPPNDYDATTSDSNSSIDSDNDDTATTNGKIIAAESLIVVVTTTSEKTNKTF